MIPDMLLHKLLRRQVIEKLNAQRLNAERLLRCIQVKKEAKELERAFGTGPQVRLPGKIAAMVRDYNGGEAEMTTIMIYGESHRVQIAKNMLLEAVENREQKQKQRQKVCHCSDIRVLFRERCSSST